MADDLILPEADRNLLALAKTDHRRAVALWAERDLDDRVRLLTAVDAGARRDLLLLSDDATETVRALPALVVHDTLRGVPDGDAVALLGCVDATQLEAFLEVDCLRGDGADRARFREWLERVLASGLPADPALWRRLDIDLLADLLRSAVHRFAIPEGEDLLRLYDHCGVVFHFTPDMVVTRAGYGRDDLVDEFLQALYALDNEVFNALCRALQTGEALDTDHRRREKSAGRRDALGLPTREEAEVLFEAVELPFALAPAAVSTGTTLAEGGPATPFFERVQERLRGHAAWTEVASAALGEDLRWIGNALLVLGGHDPEPEPIARAIGRCQRILGLALEYLADADPDLAAEILREQETTWLFRVGHRLLRELPLRLADLEVEPEVIPGHPPFDRRGLLPMALSLLREEEPMLWSGQGPARPIASLADLRCALALVAACG